MIRSNRPWKVYLIPLAEYLAVLFVLNMIRGFFRKYGLSFDMETTDLRMSKDLLLIFSILQLPAIGVFVMRVFGLDIKKFNFNTDKEFLELSEEDREEIEVSVDFDKNSLRRFWKRSIRNFKYFYEEHTLICRAVAILLIVIIAYRSFIFFFVTNKVYRQGQNYSFEGYTMKVNDVYWTDKNYAGEVVTPKSKFVIANISITNHAAPRTLKMEKFHIKSGSHDYTTTRNTYAKDFQDLGNTLEDVKEIKRDETLNFIIIYKVSASLSKNSFDFYFQENNGYLRKFKLKVKDISKIEDMGTIKEGEEMVFQIKDLEEHVAFEEYDISTGVLYSYRTCNTTNCYVEKISYVAPDGYRILTIPFSSDELEGKKMFNISKEYAKIKYIDSQGNEEEVEFKYPFVKTALGKYIYTLVPDEMESAQEINIEYILRTKKYVYQIMRSGTDEEIE